MKRPVFLGKANKWEIQEIHGWSSIYAEDKTLFEQSIALQSRRQWYFDHWNMELIPRSNSGPVNTFNNALLLLSKRSEKVKKKH